MLIKSVQPGQISEEEMLARYKRIVVDPWEFLCTCVFTKDEVDKKNPTKRFPSHYQYLKYYVRIWEKEPLIVVPKSRRMFMSWCNIGLYLHDTMFRENRFNAFQSKNEEGSDHLIDRAKFIYDHIPKDVIPPDLLPKGAKTYCRFNFDELGSEIRGFAQGADQTRQFTCSGMLFDEFAFWDKAEESYSASIPTIEGGGRCTILSSAAPGHMKKIVFDQLDNDVQAEDEDDE